MNEPRLLFRAVHQDVPVTVSLATHEDLHAIAGPVPRADDALEHWLMIAVRVGTTTRIHALGWQVLRARIFITPPIAAFDRALGAVRTAEGRGYLLSVPGRPEPDPELRALLAESMRKWGFKRIRLQSPATPPKRRGGKRHQGRSKNGAPKQAG
jgi:hypothetical protein